MRRARSTFPCKRRTNIFPISARATSSAGRWKNDRVSFLTRDLDLLLADFMQNRLPPNLIARLVLLNNNSDDTATKSGALEQFTIVRSRPHAAGQRKR
jgi:hypothetical protein